MADEAKIYAQEPTLDLPTGSAVDVFLSKEISLDDVDENEVTKADVGKIVARHGLYEYPFILRQTGNSLSGQAETIESNELRHGRTEGKKKLGNQSSEGSHDIEFSPESFDDELEGAFRSSWTRWKNDGQETSITKGDKRPEGYLAVQGDCGTYNQIASHANNGEEMPVTSVPLLFNENATGEASDPYGIVKVPASSGVSKEKPLGRYVVHELHVGNEVRKYSIVKRIPITEKQVRWQEFKDVQIGSLSFTADINAIVTGSFNLSGTNNPKIYGGDNAGSFADYLNKEKRMYINGDKSFDKTGMKEAVDAFIKALGENVEATDTDQFVTTQGCLYINGHRIQFSSNLTFELNNNLSAKYALFVKNAIAHISPKLNVNGNMNLYFTNGEVDSTGRSFGADDVLNLAAENSNVEIIFAFQNAEMPDVIYLFHIFKSTLDPSGMDLPAEDSITTELPYTSFAEKAVRCMRIALPKVRKIKADELGTTCKFTIIPNVPLEEDDITNYLNAGGDGQLSFTALETVKDATGSTSPVLTIEDMKIVEGGAISVEISGFTAAEGSSIALTAKLNGDTLTKTFEIPETVTP